MASVISRFFCSPKVYNLEDKVFIEIIAIYKII